MVKVRFQRKATWPYSIEDDVPSSIPDEIEVDESEIFERDGKRYYSLVVGHGHIVDLLVEEG